MADPEQIDGNGEKASRLERGTDALQSMLNSVVDFGDHPTHLIAAADKRTRELIRAGGHLLTYSVMPIEQARELFGKVDVDARVRRPAQALAGSVQLTPRRGYRSQTRRSTPVVRRRQG